MLFGLLARRALGGESQRYADADDRAARRPSLHRAVAAEPSRALAHAEDAQRAATRRDLGHADAVVGDLEEQPAAVELHRDLDVRGGGVARDVGQRLLED